MNVSGTIHPARSRFLVMLVFVTFFVISFLTNILGALVPDIIQDFKVSLTLAAILPFSFFMAYGIASIPAGFLVERFGEQRVMVASFLLGTGGALAFAAQPGYAVAIASLFIMGSGMAALQVAVNPLLRVAGGEAHFAFNSAFAQLIFGAASFVSPWVYRYLVGALTAQPRDGGLIRLLSMVTPHELPWVSVYWVFAVATLLMAVFLASVRMPTVFRTDAESAGTWSAYRTLLRRPVVWLYFISVMAYVGSEQGTADWISQFLYHYHGFDPHRQGASAVAAFWGLLTVGCLLGMGLLKLFDSRWVLIGFSLCAMASLSVALLAPADISLIAFPCIGFFASIMWPTLVSLALNSVPSLHGPFAGILCTGIMGGALWPLAIGRMSDLFGLRAGLSLLFLSFGAVLSVGIWARPLISNARRNSDQRFLRSGLAAKDSL